MLYEPKADSYIVAEFTRLADSLSAYGIRLTLSAADGTFLAHVGRTVVLNTRSIMAVSAFEFTVKQFALGAFEIKDGKLSLPDLMKFMQP